MTALQTTFLLLGILLIGCGAPSRPGAGNSENAVPAPEAGDAVEVTATDVARAMAFAQKNREALGSSGQVLVVFNEEAASHEAVLVTLERSAGGFVVRGEPMPAGVGRAGFALPGAKSEGDGKSPTGCYRLGRLFTYESSVNTAWPFTQTTPEDKWIDDPASPDYNRYVRGATDAASYEKLLLTSDTYRYCMVIEYNTDPVVKGKGSAIFFHLTKDIPGPTLGCVSISKSNMMGVLSWLQPDQQPVILMGNDAVLEKGI